MRSHVVFRSPMPASAERLWAWHAAPGALQRLNPPFDPAELVAQQGGLEVGARRVLRVAFGPTRQTWVAEHTACEPGRMFRDEQRQGPFARWVHTHRCEPRPDGQSELVDEIDYELPLGGLGGLAAGRVARRLARLFAYRHALTAADLERHARAAAGGLGPLTVALSGASGMVGSALRPFLEGGGHCVRALGRTGERLDATALADGAVDAVVHLAGAGIADARWSAARKRLLVASRVGYTRQLVTALAALPRRPRVLIAASAVGVYGDRGDEELTEDSAPGESAGPAGFLARLCADWEQEAAQAATLGIRVVHLRLGVVQDARGGALARLRPAFAAGLGGPAGSGRQWLSWIAAEDVLGAVLHVLADERLAGPVNVVAPAPLRAAEHAATLGRVLDRPAGLRAPALALRVLFGELADGVLLASQRALPTRLAAAGFSWRWPALEQALRFTLDGVVRSGQRGKK